MVLTHAQVKQTTDNEYSISYCYYQLVTLNVFPFP